MQRYKCVTLKYQSIEDWTEGTDILRCNPDFHGQPRFDCVIIHDDAPKLSVAQLYDIFCCRLPSGKTLDIALVRRFHCSKWKPRTVWSGCRVLDEESDTTLVQMDYLLRGVVVCPVSEREEEKSHYFIDSIDPDIFLRENSWMQFELSVTVIPTKCRLQIIYGADSSWNWADDSEPITSNEFNTHHAFIANYPGWSRPELGSTVGSSVASLQDRRVGHRTALADLPLICTKALERLTLIDSIRWMLQRTVISGRERTAFPTCPDEWLNTHRDL